jgi:hypothetical protein
MYPEEFAITPLVRNAEKISMLGTHENAPLIQAVYRARKDDIPSRKILIASPRVGIKRGDESPEVVFSRMSTVTWACSVGGWRMLNSDDFVIYSLITEMQKASGEMTETARLYLESHPAWPAVSFVYRNQPEAACRLLTEIIDPRWHIAVDEPERYAQLRGYLGFGKTILHATEKLSAALGLLRGYNGECPSCDDPRLRRTMLTVASWFGGFVEDSALTKELDRHLQQPSAFLLRYLYTESEERYDMRFVRANHRFIRFVRAVWLDNLYLPRRYRKITQTLGRKNPSKVTRPLMLKPKGYERTLFVPEHFFYEMDEVAAWKAHTAKLRRAKK